MKGSDKDVVSKVLDASGVNVDLLQSNYSAGWHGPSDIQTLKGLEGEFLLAEQSANPRVVQWAHYQEGSGNYQMFKIDRSTLLEKGVFHSVPNNPMTGYAFITLHPDEASIVKFFVVSGMVTVLDWKIEVLLLNKVGDQGLIMPPVSLVRLYG